MMKKIIASVLLVAFTSASLASCTALPATDDTVRGGEPNEKMAPAIAAVLSVLWPTVQKELITGGVEAAAAALFEIARNLEEGLKAEAKALKIQGDPLDESTVVPEHLELYRFGIYAIKLIAVSGQLVNLVARDPASASGKIAVETLFSIARSLGVWKAPGSPEVPVDQALRLFAATYQALIRGWTAVFGQNPPVATAETVAQADEDTEGTATEAIHDNVTAIFGEEATVDDLVRRGQQAADNAVAAAGDAAAQAGTLFNMAASIVGVVFNPSERVRNAGGDASETSADRTGAENEGPQRIEIDDSDDAA